MSRNTKQTSGRIATLASETLQDPSASQIARSLAASALAQRHTNKQTGADIEHAAGRVLHSPKYSEETKELAASVLSQTTKDRR
ncbi:hypothetical protein [Nevskia soli]|uniref:hypothetical protein n=1 Tax=Nevskia soli TaxID=418856 RepID=UPI0004A6F514|nr:hypothetical protein [Nevskia soli]